MRVQYQEETSHALKLYDYLLANGATVKLEPIDKVPVEWNGVKEPFEETYKHECKVTDMIHECYEVAVAERDHATSNMLKWFIDEQAEEEQNVLAILDQLNLMGENGHAVFFMDKELATRVFVDATKAPAV